MSSKHTRATPAGKPRGRRSNYTRASRLWARRMSRLRSTVSHTRPDPMSKPNTKQYVRMIFYLVRGWKWVHADSMEGPWDEVPDQEACHLRWSEMQNKAP